MNFEPQIGMFSNPVYMNPTPTAEQTGAAARPKVGGTGRPKPPPPPTPPRPQNVNQQQQGTAGTGPLLTYRRARDIFEPEEKAAAANRAIAYKQESHEQRMDKLNQGLNGLQNLSDSLNAASQKKTWGQKHLQYIKLNWSQNYGKILLGVSILALGVAATIMSGGLAPLAAIGGAALVKVAFLALTSLVGAILIFGKTFNVDRSKQKAKPDHEPVNLRNVEGRQAKITDKANKEGEFILSDFQKAFRGIDRAKDGFQFSKQHISVLRHIRKELASNLDRMNDLKDKMLRNPELRNQIQHELNYLQEREGRLKEILDNARGIDNLRESSANITPSELNRKKILLKGALVALANVQQNDIKFAHKQNPIVDRAGKEVAYQALEDSREELAIGEKDIKHFSPTQTAMMTSFLTPFISKYS